MSWTLSTSGAAIAKAGVGANSTIIASNAVLAVWSDEAEGYLNAATRYDWVTNYALVGTYFKGILDNFVAAKVAMNIVNYDMSGFSSRLEAEVVLDVLYDQITKCIIILGAKENQEVMI